MQNCSPFQQLKNFNLRYYKLSIKLKLHYLTLKKIFENSLKKKILSGAFPRNYYLKTLATSKKGQDKE